MNLRTQNPFFRVLSLLAIALALVILTPAPPMAQQETTEPPPPQPSEDPDAPKPVPSSQISIKAQETESVLKSMRDRPEPDPNITKIGEDVAEALGAFDRLQEYTDSLLEASFSLRDLEDTGRRWTREHGVVTGWQSTVLKRAQTLDRDLEVLQKGRAVWQLTLASASEAGITEALVEVINTELNSIQEVEKLFGDRRSELLTIEGQVAQAVKVVESALSTIEDARKNTARFVAFESPPLWSSFKHRPGRAGQLKQLQSAWATSMADLSTFVSANRNALINHGLLFLAFLIVLLLLNRRARLLDVDSPEIEAAKHILKRPLAAAIVLSLVIIAYSFDTAPRVVAHIMIIVLYLPLFLLLPPKAAKPLRIPVLVLFLLTVSDRFIELLAFQSPLQRLAALAIALFTGSYLLILLRGGRLRALFQGNFVGRLVSTSVAIAAGLLGVAAIANIIGYYSISDIVTSALVLSAYVGILFYVLFFIVAAIVWIGLSTVPAQQLNTIRRHEPLIRARLLLLARFFFIFLWLRATLENLQVWSYIRDGVHGAFTAEAKFGDISISLLGVVSLVVMIYASVLLSRFVRFVLEEDVYPRLWLPRGVPNAISTSIKYIILTGGFFLALAATGANLSKFAILAGAFGVGLGFGLQNIVANFVSGLILIFERPIMPGDNVQVGMVNGVVKSIGMRATIVRSWEGAEVIVPNGKLVAEDVTNWTLSDKRRRIDIAVGVAYGTDTAKVVELLTKVASDHPDTLDDPAPRPLFLGFGESSLDFQLRCWTLKIDNRLSIMSDITLAVEKAIKEAGIEIPFPQRDLHVRSVDDAARGALTSESPAKRQPKTED